jgi:hypothetical protein
MHVLGQTPERRANPQKKIAWKTIDDSGGSGILVR